MASASATISAASLAWTGGTLATNRPVVSISPASLTWAGGFLLPGKGTGGALTALDLSRVGRIASMFPVVDGKGHATSQFQLQFQRLIENLEAAINSLNTQVNSNTSIIAALEATNAVAQAANDNAQAVADTISIANSYVDPREVLTASNSGAVSILAHNRRYKNSAATIVAVDSGSVTGFASGDYVTVYYRDAARAGGAVTYIGTTKAVEQGGDVHVVGSVTIPAGGDPPATGTSAPASGYQTPPSGSTYDPDYIEP